MPALLGDKDRRLLSPGAGLIGIDEVGRGALAGPLVVVGLRWTSIPDHPWVRDSKKLSPGRRETVAPWICRNADQILMVEIWPELIDRINILEATKFAMRRIVKSLRRAGDAVVVDAVNLGPGYEDVVALPKADDTFFCVASASIVAKVHRDHIMSSLSRSFPDWLWEKNKGYGTAEHRSSLQKSGPSPLHRKSFKFTAVLP